MYTQITFVFNPLEDFYIVHDHIDVSFLFLLQKDFYIAHKHIGAFCLFLHQKDFGAFNETFLNTFFWFFVFFYNILFTILYIEKKIIKNNFISFFICFKKLTFPYRLCKLCKLYEYFMNKSKSLKMLQIQNLNAFRTSYSSSDFSSLEIYSLESSLSESEEISMLSVIHSSIFFSLTKYLHSSKNTWG